MLILSACTEEEIAFFFATDPASSYTRVDRMGMPAIATAVISSKDAYNQDDPITDVTGKWATEITANVQGLHTALDDDLAGLNLQPCATNTCVTQAAPIVIPDVLTLDLTQPSAFPNGRRLTDPVMDITLAVILLDLNANNQTASLFANLPLNPPANDVAFSNAAPYLAAPHTP